jgi:predicted nuclease with TOPRIM domain
MKGLASDGGGPHHPDMEQRLAKLESDVGEIKGILIRLEPMLSKIDDRVRKVELDVAELKGRVSQLPTTLQLVGFVLAVLGIAGLARYFGP